MPTFYEHLEKYTAALETGDHTAIREQINTMLLICSRTFMDEEYAAIGVEGLSNMLLATIVSKNEGALSDIEQYIAIVMSRFKDDKEFCKLLADNVENAWTIYNRLVEEYGDDAKISFNLTWTCKPGQCTKCTRK